MKTRHELQIHILNILENGNEMHLNEMFAGMPDLNVSTRDYHVKQLLQRGEIERVKNGVYRKPTATNPQADVAMARKKLDSAARTAEDNEETINTLLNTYDEVVAIFQRWILHHLTQPIDFEQQLLFIENFKWLTMIGDKLMKRWSLVHVGYDSNSRQAQEDAKAKTQEREKAALEDAPLKDRVMVVGKYNPAAEKFLDEIPSSLEDMTDEEVEKAKV